MDSSPVFFDPTRRRASRLRALFGLFALIDTSLLSVFWASVLYVPVARLVLHRPRFLPDSPPRPEQSAQATHKTLGPDLPPVTQADGPIPGRAAGVVGGFYVDWDETSLASLTEHAHQLTHLFPGWLHLNADALSGAT